MIDEEFRHIMDNVNLTENPVMKPLSIAICVRMKKALPQISFSKKTSSKVEIIKIPFEFNIKALRIESSRDPVGVIMQVIADECVKKFESYTPFTITFCGMYLTDKIGKFNVIFKIVK